jgi:hypothetical protein
MLGNEVASTRVQATCEKAGEEKVEEWAYAEGFDEQGVKDQLRKDVEIVPLGQTLGSDKTRPESIEENLESAEKNISL